jgi:hypothetical protein
MYIKIKSKSQLFQHDVVVVNSAAIARGKKMLTESVIP